MERLVKSRRPMSSMGCGAFNCEKCWPRTCLCGLEAAKKKKRERETIRPPRDARILAGYVQPSP
jgi:hypothetical protein